MAGRPITTQGGDVGDVLTGHTAVVVESIRFNRKETRWEWTARDPETGTLYFGTESPVMYRPGELSEGDRGVILFYEDRSTQPARTWHTLVSQTRAEIILSRR